MPDAIEIIFQSALTLGRHGAVSKTTLLFRFTISLVNVSIVSILILRARYFLVVWTFFLGLAHMMRGLHSDTQVDEMMGNTERAAARYSKSVCLLRFLLVEASSLVLNPPVSLTNSDRYRLRSYIDIISNRQGQPRSQRVGLLKCDDQ